MGGWRPGWRWGLARYSRTHRQRSTASFSNSWWIRWLAAPGVGKERRKTGIITSPTYANTETTDRITGNWISHRMGLCGTRGFAHQRGYLARHLDQVYRSRPRCQSEFQQLGIQGAAKGRMLKPDAESGMQKTHAASKKQMLKQMRQAKNACLKSGR